MGSNPSQGNLQDPRQHQGNSGNFFCFFVFLFFLPFDFVLFVGDPQ